ncbi:MAG: TonB family protein [Deltaproteobacteria bacterium]|nr:TonB family protein [Deltaproteobacteria bacterium]
MDNAPQPPAPPPEKKTLPLVIILAIVALGIPLVLSIALMVIATAGGVVAYLLASDSAEEGPSQVYADPVLDEFKPPDPMPLKDLPEAPEDVEPLAIAGTPPGDEGDAEEPTGMLEASSIKDVMKSSTNAFRFCYEKSLEKDPLLQGKVTIKFVIGTKGKVTKAEVASSTLDNAEVETCLVNRVKKLKFPEPEGGVVAVSYPLVFTPDG